MRIFSFLLIFLSLLMSSVALAEGEAKHVAAELLSPQTTVGDSDRVEVGIKLTMEDGWKTYWRTPGEAGLAPDFNWSKSKNFKSAVVKYPYPTRMTAYDIDNYVYSHEVIFPVEITVQDKTVDLSLDLHMDILVCSDICLPETHKASLILPAGAPDHSDFYSDYQKAKLNLPSLSSKNIEFKKAHLRVDTSNVHYLVIEAHALAAPAEGFDLFVEHESGVSFATPNFIYEDGKITLLSEVRTPDTLQSLQDQLSDGKMTLTYISDGKAFEADISLSIEPLLSAEPLPRPKTILDSLGIVKIMIFAFIGGLILNLMPCVLPVLSLKVLSVVSHGGKDNRNVIFKNFFASALGIITSFWLLAGGLIALRAGGGLVGWGIQFQHPAFLIFLIAIVLMFAANMWGAFEVPLPRFIAKNIPAKHEHEPTWFGHFMTGAFATLLATPCTAPFLGTAIGFALARDATWTFATFSMIGLGLAFPYLTLAISPSAFKYMPKPGPWMIKLKKILALALFATAIWLVSVLMAISTTPTLDQGWQAFDEARIESAIQNGQVVIVDVTADWCLTCKANKRIVLEQEDVVAALSGPEILKMQADWTHRNEEIGLYLQKYGRYGIPFNVVYGPYAPEGILLPELLSKSIVLNAVKEAAGE